MLRKHSLEYSSNLVLNWVNFCFTDLVGSVHWTVMKVYSGYKKLSSTCSGNIHPVWPTLPLISWDQRALQWMRKKENEKWTTVLMLHSLQREFTYLLTCGRHSLVSENQINDTAVRWITLWGMIKVYWFDFSLHFGVTLSAALLPQVWAEACLSL